MKILRNFIPTVFSVIIVLLCFSSSFAAELQHTFTRGWNLISFPLDLSSSAPSAVFNQSFGDVCRWTDGGYLFEEDFDGLSLGEGYWAYFASDTVDVMITGTETAQSTYNISLTTGWNMIGMPYATTSLWLNATIDGESVATSSIIISSLFEYDPAAGKYTETTILDPWKGYFIQVAGTSTLTLSAGSGGISNPDRPLNVVAAPCDYGEHTLLCLSWDDSETPEVTGYNISVFNDTESFADPYNGAKSVSVTRYTIGGLTPGKEYGIEVTSVVAVNGVIIFESIPSVRSTVTMVANSGTEGIISFRAVKEEFEGTGGDIIVVASAIVQLRNSGLSIFATTTTDEFGWGEFSGLATDTLTLDGVHTMGTPDESDDIKVHLPDMGIAEGNTIHIGDMMLYMTGWIQGVVHLESQTVHSEIAVSIPGYLESSTDEEGNFTLFYIPPGTWDIFASKTGYVSGMVEDIEVISSQKTTISEILELKQSAGSIYGYAFKQGSANHLDINVNFDPDGPLIDSFNIQTASNGYFYQDGLDPGGYMLTASCDGFESYATYTTALANAEINVGEMLLLDTSFPTVSGFLPVTGTYTSDSAPDISASFSDVGSGITTSSATILVNSVDVTSSASIATSGFTYSPVSSLSDGEAKVEVTVYDSVGNSTYASSTFYVDTTDPSILDFIPVSGTYTSDSTPDFSATFTDSGSGVKSSSATTLVNSVDVTPFASIYESGYTYTPTEALSDGDIAVVVTVYDSVGNSTNASSTFYVDTTPPTVSDFMPVSGNCTADATPDISAAFTDDGSGVTTSSATVLVNSIDVTSFASITTSGFIYTPADDLSDGEIVVEITLFDYVGNQTNASSSFNIDTTAIITAVTEDTGGTYKKLFDAIHFTLDANGEANGTAYVDVGTITGVTLYDDGTNGDTTAGDGIYKRDYIIDTYSDYAIGVPVFGHFTDYLLNSDIATSSTTMRIYPSEFVDSGQALGNYHTYSLFAADVDNDGDIDFISGNYDSGDRIWLNSGTGEFTDSGQSLGGNNDTFSVFAADVDRDGDIDFIEGNVHDEANLVWLNNGSGSFTDSGQILGSIDTVSVFAADMDNDGDVDFLEGSESGISNLVWLNNGSGIFTNSGQIIGDEFTNSSFVVDLDNDGDNDIIIGNCTGENKVWQNNGVGSFVDTGQSLGNSITYSVFATDVDGDGDTDFIEGNFSYEANIVWMNDGLGAFNDSGQTLGSSRTGAIFAADLDSDGDVDFIEGNYGEANKIWHNDGTGAFTDTGQSLGSGYTESLFAADLDSDGDTDFISGNIGEANRIWLNTGMPNTAPTIPTGTGVNRSANKATLSWAPASDTKTPQVLLTYEVAISTQSGIVDTSATSAFPGNIRATTSLHLQGLDTNTFYFWSVRTVDSGLARSAWTTEEYFSLLELSSITITPGSDFYMNRGATQSFTAVCTFFDLSTSDCTTIGEWVISNSEAGSIIKSGEFTSVSENGDTSTVKKSIDGVDSNIVSVYVRGFKDSGQSLGLNRTKALFAVDVDDDGDIDFISGNKAVSQVWQNDGSGVFTYEGQSLGNNITYSVFAADVDSDGDVDAIIGNVSTQNNRIWQNDGTGGFSDYGQTLGNNSATSLSAVDVDRDGDLDFISGNDLGANRVWLNNSKGIFTDSTQRLGSSNTQTLFATDVDSDGDIDFISGNVSSQANRVWMNDGEGIFTDSGQTLGSNNTQSIFAVDVNNNGYIDFIEGDSNYEGNHVWMNDGAGSFTDSGQSLGSDRTTSVFSADVDNDGDSDFIEGNYQESVRVLLNDGTGVFSDSGQVFSNDETQSVFAADVDNDGDIDFIEGIGSENSRPNRVWLNFFDGPNTAPSTPVIAQPEMVIGNHVELEWSSSSDSESQDSTLTYYFAFATTSGIVENTITGSFPGNIGATTTWRLINLASGTYHWSVRAVDGGLMQSPWAGEESFSIP